LNKIIFVAIGFTWFAVRVKWWLLWRTGEHIHILNFIFGWTECFRQIIIGKGLILIVVGFVDWELLIVKLGFGLRRQFIG
jgi:hypothetical protein